MADSGTYTQDVYQRRQQLAQKLYLQGQGSQSRNWAEGLGNAAETALGAYQMAKADAQKKVDDYESKKAIAEILGTTTPAAPDLGSSGASKIAGLLGSDWPSIKASPAAMPPVPPPAETSGQLLPPPVAPAPQTSFPGATEVQTGSNGQKIPIYGKSDDAVPSPLDPPSGQDRTRMIATILGESANQPAAGQNAVASVIRNRAVAGNYGGRSPSEVVTARNQFEPWNTQGGRDKMGAMAADPRLAGAADRAIAMAYGEGGQAPNDPTGGAKNFIEPKLQTALGRPMPDWAKAPGVMIGDHKFIGGAPSQQPYEVAGPPTAAPQAPVAQAMAPPQMPQPQGGGGLLATATPQQRAVIAAGMNASEDSPARAIATAMLGNLTKAEGPTDEIKEYTLDSAQRKARGEQPLSFFDFKSGLKKAGATNVTTNVGKDEEAFDKEAGKIVAGRFNDLAAEGPQAKQMISDVQTLQQLGTQIGTGKTAQAKATLGPYAEALGVKIDGLSDIQAYEAIVNRLAPNLRVKGSGAQSDLELKNFLKSLPSLGNTPGGNELISKTMEGLAANKAKAAEIGSMALNKEITRKEAEKQLRELPDPMQGWREAQKAAKPAAAPETAAPDRVAIEAEMKRRGLLK